MEALARAGYGARGCVYLMVGILAVLAAIGRGGQACGGRSALGALLDQPFGAILVGILSIGLLAFAIWRFVSAAFDADRHGSGPKGLAVRAGRLVSGGAYAGLAVTAVGMAIGRYRHRGDEDAAARDWTAWLMTQPAGRYAVAAIGLTVAGVGASYAIKAIRNRVADRLDVPPDRLGWVQSVGRAGFAARSVVFLIIGGFLVAAAWTASSREVTGLGGALSLLRQQPYGWALLVVVAAGLAAFGLFGLLQARYRRVEPPDVAGVLTDGVRAAGAKLRG